MNQKMKSNCPICKEQYYSISKSLDICERHEEWLITQCSVCGRMCFSDSVGVCIKCGGRASDRQIGGKRNPRGHLIASGYEEYE
jgi:C4-type Zn-finger protein